MLVLRVANASLLYESIDRSVEDLLVDHSMHKFSDSELADVVRSRVETLYDSCYTARMATLDEAGVVDPY